MGSDGESPQFADDGAKKREAAAAAPLQCPRQSFTASTPHASSCGPGATCRVTERRPPGRCPTSLVVPRAISPALSRPKWRSSGRGRPAVRSLHEAGADNSKAVTDISGPCSCSPQKRQQAHAPCPRAFCRRGAGGHGNVRSARQNTRRLLLLHRRPTCNHCCG
jgi:hypothetical protein